MRNAFGTAILSLSLLLPAAAQQTTSTSQSSPQALQLLQTSLNAMTGGVAITDATLSGSIEYVAGSEDESGAVTVQDIAAGASRTELDLPSGKRVEVRNLAAATQTGTWSGPDGVAHAVAQHNLLTEMSWMFPIIAISRGLAESGAVGNYVGAESFNAAAVQHVGLSQPFSGATVASPDVAKLTQLDIFLDSTTSLPAGVSFNIHPDDNASIDIPVTILFSDYRNVRGVQVPFHVQRLVNNQLALDLHFSNVVLNSGLTPTQVAP